MHVKYHIRQFNKAAYFDQFIIQIRPENEIIIASKEEFKIEHERMSIFVLDLLQAKCKCTHITLYKMIS